MVGISRSWLVVLAVGLPFAAAQAQLQAPDASGVGPFATASGEYRLPSVVDPDIRSGVVTEVWANTHYPTDAVGDLPLLVFLHGNHATCGRGSNPRIDDDCQYTFSGTCPGGYVVTPNHEGYDYIADRLASWGYVVVSINANRGINCAGGDPGDTGLNKARGRLILKHLQLIGEWNLGLGSLPGAFDASLQGRLDFEQVGLMGHSRGGEGVRAAYNFYGDPGNHWLDDIPEPLAVRAIFEIAAVDGQTDRVFDAEDVVWNQILPMCDGDVADLQGIQPMDRMMSAFEELNPTPKSSYLIWGANHNFFNEEWQTSDSLGCLDHSELPAENTGSAAQRAVGRAAVMALFRGAVGPDADSDLLTNFNPAFTVPTVVSDETRVDRGYVDSPNRTIEVPVEDFTQPTGTNRYGFRNQGGGGITGAHTTVPEHDPSLRAARLEWPAASPARFVRINTNVEGAGRNASGFETLTFRISRQRSQPDFSSSTDLSVSLIDADEVESVRLLVSDYYDLTGPVGSLGFFNDTRHPILQTVRLPLADFVGADLTRFRSIRFSFDIPNPGVTSDDGGAIHLADIRLSVEADGALALDGWPEVYRSDDEAPAPAAEHPRLAAGAAAEIVDIVALETSPFADGGAALEVTVRADHRFPVGDALPELRVGDVVASRGGRYSPDTRQLTFVVPVDRLRLGAEVEVRIGGLGRWSLGGWSG